MGNFVIVRKSKTMKKEQQLEMVLNIRDKIL